MCKCKAKCNCNITEITKGEKGDTGATGPQGPAGTLPYKVYVASLNQTGTDTPTAIILQNTLGGEPVWSRNPLEVNPGDFPGQYRLTLTGAFTGTVQIIPPIDSYGGGGVVNWYGGGKISDDELYFSTSEITNTGTRTLADGCLFNGYSIIEIRVYN